MPRQTPLFVSLLLLGGCAASGGVSDLESTKQNPIVNGTESGASFETVGFLAGPSGGSYCTGTLIGPHTVLTAAHCVHQDGRTTPARDVRFGFGPNDRAASALHPVAEVVVHPSYSETALTNDLAMLILSSDLSIAPTPLHTAAVGAGNLMTLVGYGVAEGRTDTGGGTKRNVNVTVAVVESGTWRYNTTGGRSACRGDSGGPAFFNVGGGLELAGVTSWGDETCTTMGNYTRIDVYLDWIRTGLDGASPPSMSDPGVPPGDPAPSDPAPSDPAPSDPPPSDPPPMDPIPVDPGPGSATCSNTCPYAFDGICDDGGPGAAYYDCEYGSDCGDCGARSSAAPEPPPPTPGGLGFCDDSCFYAGDGVCDDGGPGAAYADCFFGTDCSDCGAR